MENILTEIRLMTAIERELVKLSYGQLIMSIWDIIGCDFEENISAINRIIAGEELEVVVEDFKYEFLSNKMIEYEYLNMMHYLLYRDEIEFLAQWDDLSNKEIVLYIANYIIRNEIYPVVQKVLATPLEENNDIINDLN